jgi:hypothetical protein
LILIIADYSFLTLPNIQGLDGGFVYNTSLFEADRTIFLPNAIQFASVFGSFYSCYFTIMRIQVIFRDLHINIDNSLDNSIGASECYINGVLKSFNFVLPTDKVWTVQIEKKLTSGIHFIAYYFREG